MLLRNPAGTPAQLRPVAIDDTVRSARLEGVSPVGDIAKVPEELSWQPVANAGSYRIRLQDIEQKTIWEGSSIATTVPLPREAQSQMMNRKTLYWQVDALDAARKPLASSGPQQFRVVSAQ